MPEISPYLIVPLVTLVVSQIVKFAADAFTAEIDFKKLIGSGGSPSSRIAVVVSLMVTALAVDGIGASASALAAILGGLYIFERVDAQNRSASVYGGLVGLLSGVILTVTYWEDRLGWLFDQPSTKEVNIEFIAFGATLVIAELLCFLTRRKSMRKLPTSRKLSRAFRLSYTLPALFGLAFAFAQQQTLGLFDIRIWTYLVVVWMIAATGWFWWNVYRHARAHLKEEAAHFKKAKTTAKKKKAVKKTTKKKRKK